MNKVLSEADTKAVSDILAEALGVAPAQLTPEARIEGDLGADSLTRVEIGMAMEDRFNVSIPDEQWGKISTVGDVHEALAGLLGRP